ncbi:hypothetical protein [Undibacterium griseum]|uniref:Uncharacterized protein n=1 Tax=Undibacterium griseum TaxID=2762295 RepID=A0ABR6YPL9_9BURK|nr:hypothetical protein [Undibacterium griseum]MBC3885730.1 hypothetical protein [Undibacterium griseum]
METDIMVPVLVTVEKEISATIFPEKQGTFLNEIGKQQFSKFRFKLAPA